MMCVSWNVQSIRNKCAQVIEHILDHDTDVVFLSETWMEADKNDITALIKTYGYKLIHNRRQNRDKEGGGGVGVMLKVTMPHKHVSCKSFSSFEHTMVQIQLKGNSKIMLISIYRLQLISPRTFIDEFTELLEMLSVSTDCFVLTGDINFHLETDDHYATCLKELFKGFNLVQYVNFATHKLGHTLDLVLARWLVGSLTHQL